MDKERYIKFLKDLLEENNIEFKKAFKENKWKYQIKNKKHVEKIISKNFIIQRVNSKYFKISDVSNNKVESLQQIKEVKHENDANSKLSNNKSVQQNNEENQQQKLQINEIKDEDNISIINDNISFLIKEINNKLDSSVLDKNKIHSSIPNEIKQNNEYEDANYQKKMGDKVVKEDLRIINNTTTLNKGRNYNKNKKRRNKIKNKNKNNNNNKTEFQKQNQSLILPNSNQFSNQSNNKISAISCLHPSYNMDRIISMEEFVKTQNMPGFQTENFPNMFKNSFSICQNNNIISYQDDENNNNIIDVFKNNFTISQQDNKYNNTVSEIDTTSFKQQQLNEEFHGVKNDNNINNRDSNSLNQIINKQNSFKTNQDVVTLDNIKYKEKGTNINENNLIKQQIINNNMFNYNQNENNNNNGITRAQQNKSKAEMEEMEKLNQQLFEAWKNQEEFNKRMYLSNLEQERMEKEAIENYRKQFMNQNNGRNSNKIEENKNRINENKNEEINKNNKFLEEIDNEEGINNGKRNEIQIDKNNEINNKEEVNSENKNNSEQITKNNQKEVNNEDKNNFQLNKNELQDLNKNKLQEEDEIIKVQEEEVNRSKTKNQLQDNKNKINKNKYKLQEEVNNEEEQKVLNNNKINKNKNKINKNEVTQNINNEINSEEELIKQINEEEMLIQAENDKLESIYNLHIGKLVNSTTKLTSTQENEILKFRKQVDKLSERETQLQIKKSKLSNSNQLRRVQNKLSISSTQTQDVKNMSSVLSPLILIKQFFLSFILFFLGLFKNNGNNKTELMENEMLEQSQHINEIQCYINNLEKQGADNGGGNNSNNEEKNNNGNSEIKKIIVKKKDKKKNKKKNH